MNLYISIDSFQACKISRINFTRHRYTFSYLYCVNNTRIFDVIRNEYILFPKNSIQVENSTDLDY